MAINDQKSDEVIELSEDIETLARGGRTNISGFFFRLIARIPYLWVAGQWYGAAAMGRLAFVVAIVEFFAQVSTVGLKRGIALHLNDKDNANGAWDAIFVILLASILPTIFFMAFPGLLFPNSETNPFDYLLPLIIPVFALTEVLIAALAFRGDVESGMRARSIVEPWVISISAIVLWQSFQRDGLLMAYALAMVGALLTVLIPFLKNFGPPRDWRPQSHELFALARLNVPLAVADAVEWASRRVDVVILSLFVTPSTVGIYWIAQQLASLPQRLKTSFDTVLGPAIVRKLEEHDLAGVAKQISQVGFWILASQAGIALALAIPGKSLMELVGPARGYVTGTGALSFLLIAEVLVAPAIVSEAVLVYIARLRNLAISVGVIATQIGLSFGSIIWLRANGFDELFQAAAAAASLAISLMLSSLIKSRFVMRLLGHKVSVWRWPLLGAVAVGTAVGEFFIRFPQWMELGLGIPAILASYALVIWRWGFGPEDRTLFQKAKA